MLKIIVADDEPFFIDGLKILINWEKHGYEIIEVAYNGEEALEKIVSQQPDVVITDLRMPGIEGLELVRKCTKELHLKTKFVVISGYDDFIYAQKAMKYGVNHYILKPVDEEALINALSEIKSEILKRTDIPEIPYSDFAFTGDLIYAISKNDLMAIAYEIEKFTGEISRTTFPSGHIRAFTNNLFLEITKTVHSFGGDASEFIENNLELTTAALTSTIDIAQFLNDFCRDCAQFIADLRLRQTNGLIVKIERYIKENYHENINLKKISEVFYISPVYLGQLFSKHFNIYFNDYLTKIRLDEAEKLLRTTDLKVYEVADKVGFQNVDYFIKKFKKRVNCTPLHYRSQSNTKA